MILGLCLLIYKIEDQFPNKCKIKALEQKRISVCLGYHHEIPQSRLKIAEIYFSWFWRLGSPRSGCWQIRCLVRACFQICRWLSFSCVLTLKKEPESKMGGFFHKGTNSIHGGHDLITSQKPYLLIPSQGGGRRV